MAKPAKIPEKSGTIHEDEGTAKPGRNGFDPDTTRGLVDRHENLQSQIDEIMEQARADCQPLRDDQKEIKREAADEHQIPKKVFSAVLRERRLRAKAEAAAEALNEPQKETFDQVKHALGMIADLPLGAVVLDKAEGSSAAEKLAEKAYDRGYAAGGTSEGVKVETNPYEDGTDQHQKWKDGFLARQAEIASEMAPEPADAAA